jgi:hypothetical protein
MTTRVLEQPLLLQARHQTRDLTLVRDPHEIGNLSVTDTRVLRDRRQHRVRANRQTSAGSGRSPGRPAKAGPIGRPKIKPLSREGARTRLADWVCQLLRCCPATTVGEHDRCHQWIQQANQRPGWLLQQPRVNHTERRTDNPLRGERRQPIRLFHTRAALIDHTLQLPEHMGAALEDAGTCAERLPAPDDASANAAARPSTPTTQERATANRPRAHAGTPNTAGIAAAVAYSKIVEGAETGASTRLFAY